MNSIKFVNQFASVSSKDAEKLYDFIYGRTLPIVTNVFEIFNQIDMKNIKCVIMGQDPYPVTGVATGIPFGVKRDARLQPSLKIMFNELINNYYKDPSLTYDDFNPTLWNWVEQGVLLLNASMTVFPYQPEGVECLDKEGTNSYMWRTCFMEKFISLLNEDHTSLPFAFLGKKAQYYSRFVNEKKNYVIKVAHPVADIRMGKELFQGSGLFQDINRIISSVNGAEEIIKWKSS